MMKTTLKNDTLTVVTDITKAMVESPVVKLVAEDKDGNIEFVVDMSGNGKGELRTFALVGNKYINGKLTLVMNLPLGTTLEKVQAEYGQALMNAKKYTERIVAEQAAKVDELNELIEVEEEIEVECDCEECNCHAE